MVMFCILVMSHNVIAQVPKTMVLAEKFSGTWCASCPVAVHRLHELIANENANVAIISYQISDSYEISGNSDRDSYYSVSGYPSIWIDGIHHPYPHYDYAQYVSAYNTQEPLMSDFDISTFDVTNSGNSFNLDINVDQVSGVDVADLKMFAVLTETHIPEYWVSEPELLDVARLSITPIGGESLSLTQGGAFSNVYSFNLDPTWIQDNCKITVYIQNNTTKEVYQTNQISIADLSEADDAVAEFITSDDANCSSQYGPRIRVRNSGTNPLTSMDITYSINGEPDQTYSWSGNIAFTENEEIELPVIPFTLQSTNSIAVELKLPNGNTDEFPSDNTASYSFDEAVNVEATTLYLEYKTYQSGSGDFSSWELINSQGTVLYSDNYNTSADHNVVHNETFILPLGECYDFIAYDVDGDGITYSGYWQITDASNNTLFDNDPDGYSERHHHFTNKISGLIETDNSSLTIYPNPTKGIVMIDGLTSNMSIFVRNTQGRLLLEKIVNNESFELNLSDLSAGVYFISVNHETYRIILK